MIDQERRYRLHPEIGTTHFSDDAERISQSYALRRLAGVTQVISATEGEIYHNRLTHSIKVSRIARLIGKRLLDNIDDKRNYPGLKKTIEKLGGLNLSVVEAAALAHDIGHPPFGHCGEQELNRLVLKYGWGIEEPDDENKSTIARDRRDGFEGNAQSFRLVTKLAPRHSSWPGLNLTCATLNGMLKYPWLRSEANSRKYGAYFTEAATFEKTREASDIQPNVRTLEAEIMDWADDVAYATHDLEDFYRAGLIELDRLFLYSVMLNTGTLMEPEQLRYKHDFIEHLQTLDASSVGKAPEHSLMALIQLLPFQKPFGGTLDQQKIIREVFSALIEDYIERFQIAKGKISLPESIKYEVEILKQFTIYYVIQSRALQTQQHGEQKILRYIFERYFEASTTVSASTIRSSILPADFYDFLKLERDEHGDDFPDTLLRARVVADVISRMTDEDMLQMYQRLSGNVPGSVFDRIS